MAADIQASADQGGRYHPGRAQGDRHAIADNLIPGQRPAVAVDRYRSGAVREPDKDPEVYDRLKPSFSVHGCRQVSELAYGEELVAKLRDDEFLGPLLSEKLLYYRP